MGLTEMLHKVMKLVWTQGLIWLFVREYGRITLHICVLPKQKESSSSPQQTSTLCELHSKVRKL